MIKIFKVINSTSRYNQYLCTKLKFAADDKIYNIFDPLP